MIQGPQGTCAAEYLQLQEKHSREAQNLEGCSTAGDPFGHLCCQNLEGFSENTTPNKR